MNVTKHALIIGGTGMLRNVSLALAEQGYLVSVVARREKRLRELARDAASGQINPICLDYHEPGKLKTAAAAAANKYGPFQLAVVWIHGSAPNAVFELAELLNGQEQTCRYLHVLGSSAADPSVTDSQREVFFAGLRRIEYQEIILGFVLQQNSSRWLTHSEISSGVLEAVESGEKRVIVGTVTPWAQKPLA